MSNKQLSELTDAKIRDVKFDFDHPAEIPTTPPPNDGIRWIPMERGSDEHIAMLEQALSDLQATLVDLKAKRATRDG